MKKASLDTRVFYTEFAYGIVLNADDILIDLEDMDVGNSSPGATEEPSARRIVLHRVTGSPKGKHYTPCS